MFFSSFCAIRCYRISDMFNQLLQLDLLKLLLLLSYLCVGHCQGTDVPCVSGSTVSLHCIVCLVFKNK